MRPDGDLEAMGELVTVPAARGDVILFSNLVLHGSGVNHSDGVRWSLDWRVHASPSAQGTLSPKETAAAAWWGNRAWWVHPGGGIDARPSYADWQKEDPMGLEVAAGRSAGFGATTPTEAEGGPRL